MHLTVIHDFADFRRGDKIRDPDLIKSLLDDKQPHENRSHVVRTADLAPEPTKKST